MASPLIAYIGGFELPDKNAAAHRVLTNAKLLKEIGFSVVLIGISKGQTEAVRRESCRGFPAFHLRYPTSEFEWLKRYFGVADYLSVLQNASQDNLRAIIFYNEKSFLQYALRRWAKARNIKVISDVTEWYAYEGWSIGSLFKKSDVTARMHLLNGRSDGLITTSSFITNYYARRGMPRERIVELPTLFDCATAANTPGRAAEQQRNGLKLTYCGSPFNISKRRAPRPEYLKERLDKTIDVFLRIRAARPGTTLSVFGVTIEQFLQYYPGYRSVTAECGSALMFHGAVPNRTALDHVASSDFTIFFRDKNRVTLSGFPTKFAESITHGTPVITNLLPSIENYVVPERNCFLIDPHDPTNVESTVRRLAALDQEEILSLKRLCIDSKLFDFRAYREPMCQFAVNVGLS
jgi:hypothetical protein